MHHPPHRGAFTLIELLVVVAIIGVLIAILLPALGKARDQAKTSACIGNLHGIGIASAAYSADNLGALAPSYVNKFDSVSPQVAIEDLLQAYLPQGNTSDGNTPSNVALRTTQGKVWCCPVAKKPDDVSSPQYPNTYDANMGVHIRSCPNGEGQYPPLKRISQLLRPADVIALADASQVTGVENSGSGYFDYTGSHWGPDDGHHAYPGGDGGFDDQTQKLYPASNYALPPSAAFNDTDSNNWNDLRDVYQTKPNIPMPYHIRSRHNQNTASNTVMADGHAVTFKHNTILYQNLSTAY